MSLKPLGETILPAISQRIASAEAVLQGLTLREYAPNSDGVDEFRQLANAIERIIAGRVSVPAHRQRGRIGPDALARILFTYDNAAYKPRPLLLTVRHWTYYGRITPPPLRNTGLPDDQRPDQGSTGTAAGPAKLHPEGACSSDRLDLPRLHSGRPIRISAQRRRQGCGHLQASSPKPSRFSSLPGFFTFRELH